MFCCGSICFIFSVEFLCCPRVKTDSNHRLKVRPSLLWLLNCVCFALADVKIAKSKIIKRFLDDQRRLGLAGGESRTLNIKGGRENHRK